MPSSLLPPVDESTSRNRFRRYWRVLKTSYSITVIQLTLIIISIPWNDTRQGCSTEHGECLAGSRRSISENWNVSPSYSRLNQMGDVFIEDILLLSIFVIDPTKKRCKTTLMATKTYQNSYSKVFSLSSTSKIDSSLTPTTLGPFFSSCGRTRTIISHDDSPLPDIDIS